MLARNTASSGEISEESEESKEPSRLKLGEKVALVVGSAPNTFHSQLIQMYLLFFYTDFMKISPAVVAVLFLVVRIVNALMAPIFGAFVDKVRTPWGKYTPWFVLLGVPFGIVGWLTFTVPDLGETGRLVYAIVTYTVYGIFSSIITIPGSAVVPAVTRRLEERISIGQMGFLFVLLGALLVQVGVVPLYKTLGGGNDARGFSLLMAAVAVLTIAVSIYQATRVKEKYVVDAKEEGPSPSFKRMLNAVFTNKYAVILYVYMFANALSAGIRSGVQIHFYKYFFENESLMALMGIIALVPTLLGVAFSQRVIRRFGLKRTIMAGVIANLATCPIFLFIPANNIGLLIQIAATCITSLMGGFGTPATGALMPAAIDYTEWRSGLKLNGFMSSFNGFNQGVATALSGAIAAGSLSLIGYEPGVEQSSATLFGLRILIGVLPAVFGAFAICMLWFDLTEEKQKQIFRDLSVRRKQQTHSESGGH